MGLKQEGAAATTVTVRLKNISAFEDDMTLLRQVFFFVVRLYGTVLLTQLQLQASGDTLKTTFQNGVIYLSGQGL